MSTVKDDEPLPARDARDSHDPLAQGVGGELSFEDYRALLEQQSDLVVKIDPHGRLVHVSPGCCAAFGKTRTELLGQPFVALFHEDDRPATSLALERLAQAPHTCRVELRALTAGGWRVHSWTSTAIVDGEGHVTAVVASGSDLTEQRRAEAQLSSFKEAIDVASDAIGMSTPEGKHFYQNIAFDRLFGDVGENPRASLYADPATANEVFASIMAGGRWNEEVEIRAANGTLRSILLRAYAVTDRAGRVSLLVGVHTDITAQKQARQELLDQRQFLHSVLASIQDGISVLNPDLTIRYTNPVMEQWYAANLPLRGKRCFSCYHNANAPCEPCPTLRCIETGATEMNVVPGLPGSATEWVELYSYPIRDPDSGQVTGVVEFVRDITARKRSENMVALERERLAVTLRSIGDAVITTDIHGQVVLMNGVAEQLTGWPLAEARGRPLGDVFAIVDQRSRTRCASPVDRVLATGEVIELADHTALIARDRSERVIADSGAPILSSSGETLGVVLVFRDMTEKLKLLEASQTNQKLEALRVLAGGIAHDFNNLLAGVFGCIDLARDESRESAVQEELIHAMTALERARALTRQLLTFAKGGAPLKQRRALAPLIRNAVQFALSGSNVSCQFDLPAELWPCEVDPNQLAQAIDNLVINAQQAMPDGGMLTMTAENLNVGPADSDVLSPGAHVRVSLTDQGIGMPPEIISRIFDPFFSTKAHGHGLGLATTYSIIARHHGTIRVESRPGKGSTFHIYLPAAPGPAPTEEVAELRVHRGHGRVLVMDDEAVVRDVLSKMLIHLGYEVTTTTNGRQAIDAYLAQRTRNEPFVALFFDLTIPGDMPGTDAIRHIRELDRETPAFVSSGYADDEVMANPSHYGFTASLLKPMTLIELSDLLDRYVTRP